MSLAYYSEIDPYAAHWLRNLIAAGQIAPGVVDERDIRDVRPEELIGFTQVHMFAGIGVWSHALRRAGWSDDRPIWTGSCPCQPFSAAGRAGGFTDERHLWPHWFWLIEQCRPPIVIGEQVASKDGLGWLDLVSTDMEGAGYAFGALDLCAAGIGVEWQDSQSGEWLRRAIHDCVDPVVRSMLCDFADWAGAGNIDEGGNHIRQRLYFVGLADTAMRGREPCSGDAGIRGSDDGPTAAAFERGAPRASSGLADSDGRDARAEREQSGGQYRQQPGDRGAVERLADSMSARRPERGAGAGSGQTAGLRAAGRMDDDNDARPQGHAGDDGAAGREGSGGPVAAPGVSVGLADTDGKDSRTGLCDSESAEHGVAAITGRGCDGERPNATDGRRYAKDWLFCRDGKWRAVEPRTFPLVNGATARVGKLRAFGNALDAETATRFCETVKELIDG